MGRYVLVLCGYTNPPTSQGLERLLAEITGVSGSGTSVSTEDLEISLSKLSSEDFTVLCGP